jgi:hypothetical protein
LCVKRGVGFMWMAMCFEAYIQPNLMVNRFVNSP